MFKQLSHKQFLFFFGIVVSACYILLLNIFGANDIMHMASSDSMSYLGAWDMLQNDLWHELRTPGYPIFLGILKGVSTSDTTFLYLVYSVQILFWFGTMWLIIGFLPKQIKWYHLAIIILVILNPSFIQYTGLLLTESLFMFLIVLSFYFMKKYFRNEKSNYLVLFNLIILLAVLVRPGLYYFCLLSLACTILLLIKKRTYLQVGALLVTAGLLLGYPMLKMKAQHGNYTLSYIDVITQYRYLNSQCVAIEKGDAIQKVMAERDLEFDNKKPISDQRIAIRKETKTLLTNKTAYFFTAFGKNLFLNAQSPNEYISKKSHLFGKHLYNFSRMLNMFFVVILFVCIFTFLIKILKRKAPRDYLFHATLLFFCFYCWFTSGVSFFQGDRFNIVWIPLLTIFIFQFVKEKDHAQT